MDNQELDQFLTSLVTVMATERVEEIVSVNCDVFVPSFMPEILNRISDGQKDQKLLDLFMTKLIAVGFETISKNLMAEIKKPSQTNRRVNGN